MKHLSGLAVLLTLTTSTGIAYADRQEVRTCDFEVKARCVSGDATVTLTNGVVTKIEVEALWCGLKKGAPGYTCTIDSSRSDKDAVWSDDHGVAVITNASPFTPGQPDRVKVTVGRHVSIDMAEAQSLGRCGAGAALPRAIVIPGQKGRCRVWLGSP
jgi:hypothetical protein